MIGTETQCPSLTIRDLSTFDMGKRIKVEMIEILVKKKIEVCIIFEIILNFAILIQRP